MLDKTDNAALKSLFKKEFLLQRKFVPLEMRNGILKIGMRNPTDQECIVDIGFMSSKTVIPVPINNEELNKAWEDLFGEKPVYSDETRKISGEFEVIEKSALKDTDENGGTNREWDDFSVVSIVNKMITGAIDSKASDIHVEAYEDSFRVRYRHDGVLRETLQPPMDKKRAIVSRIKIMADLDIAEKRRPQDGRIRVRRGDHLIDIRISTLPTDFGEKVVMRILDKSQLNLDLENLGFDPEILARYRKILAIPYGMILVTGPTGSGKTTTLYATLNALNSPDVNIVTIEDPIEYNLDGINQSQVKSEIGYTFANALRSFLRQDPDIIMVGEIRDQETAEIAVRSALTGHLVLSTLHTNNAADTLTRLLDMGQEPFLLASSIKLVIAQRLVRLLCESCKIVDEDRETRKRFIEHFPEIKPPRQFFREKGCGRCNDTGYMGRTAVFEALPVTDAVAEAVHRRAGSHELRDIAKAEGMQTLADAAAEKVVKGETTLDEIIREIGF